LRGLSRPDARCGVHYKDNHPFEPVWQAKRSDFSAGKDTNYLPYWTLHLPRTKTGVPGNVYLGFPARSIAHGRRYPTCSGSFRQAQPRHQPSISALGNFFSLQKFIDAVRLPLVRAPRTWHNFRIGGATPLVAAGYSDHVIRQAGRWQSDAFLANIRQHHRILPQTAAVVASLPFPSSWSIAPGR
jgi:hypothetical protein